MHAKQVGMHLLKIYDACECDTKQGQMMYIVW